MADPETYEIIEDERTVDEHKSWSKSGLILDTGQSLRQFGGNVMAFILEKNISSGVFTEKNAACDDADDWTDLYTVPTGCRAYVSITAQGTFSLAITATHVEGASAPA